MNFPIETLENTKVNIWNGKEFSNVCVKKTADSSELITVQLSDIINLHKNHKFYIQDQYVRNDNKKDILESKYVRSIDAQHLKENMKLIKCDYPVINGDKKLKSAYTNGFLAVMGRKKFLCRLRPKWNSKMALFGNKSLQLCSIHKDFLMKIKFIL